MGSGRGFGPPGGGFGGFRRRGGEGDVPVGADGTETMRMEGDRVALQFPNNPVADILSIYERLTGITLIKDTAIFEGAPISLVTPRAVTKEEAVKLIEASLLTNGYAIVIDEDGKSARILPARNQSATAVQFSHGVRFYTSAHDLPDGATIVTYFMQLDYLEPETAAQMFSGHVGLSVYGRITPVTNPPGLLLTESASVVKQLIAIREAIDISGIGSSLVTKFIPLKYADAATVAQIIQATITAQAQEKETKGVNTIRGSAVSDGRANRDDNRRDDNRQEQSRPQQPIIVNGQVMQPGQAQAPAPSAQVVADGRLNQLLVISTPDDYIYIASMIAEFDKPVDIIEPYERKLRYASAVDVLSALVDLLQDTSGGAVQLPGGGTLQQQRAQPLASSSSQLLTGRNTRGSRGGQVGSTSAASLDSTSTSTSSSSGIGSRADVITAPTEDNAPISVLVNKTRVVADPMANAILVMGPKEQIDKVNSLLDKLDQKPAQVYLATVIGQLTLGKGMDFGVTYANLFNSRATRNTTVTALRNDLIRGALNTASGLHAYGTFGNSVDALVTALESTQRFKVLSRPTVFALNNKKAVITSGQMIPVPSQSTTTLNGGNNNNVTTTVEYRDVVLKLEVVPLINSDGEVTLTIAQVNDTVVGTQVIEPNEIPIIGTEQIVTSVTVPDGKTIVIGGLISDSDKRDTAGVPFLSRIPGLGALFRETNDDVTRTELIIFIQPRVVTTDSGLDIASLREDLRTQVGADAAARFPNDILIDDAQAKEIIEVTDRKTLFSRMFRRSGDRSRPAPAPSMRR